VLYALHLFNALSAMVSTNRVGYLGFLGFRVRVKMVSTNRELGVRER